MAGLLLNISSSSIICLTLLFLFSTTAVDGKSQPFSRRLTQESLGLKDEKITNLHFYFHDIPSGSNPSAVRVAKANTTANNNGFSAVVVFDDPLTMQPELNSTLVGRAQGIYTLAAQNEAALLMVYNLVFTQGEYNGSTLSVLGRNSVFSEVREMPVTGGTGIFRLARGYAQARTYSFNLTSGDTVDEFDVFVIHYNSTMVSSETSDNSTTSGNSTMHEGSLTSGSLSSQMRFFFVIDVLFTVILCMAFM